MSTNPPSLPKCPSEDDLKRSRKRWEEESYSFVQSLSDKVDDAEIFIRHKSIRGWRFAEQALQPLQPPPQGECYVRLFKGGHTVWARFPLSPSIWRKGVVELIQAFSADKVGIYRPPQPRIQHPCPTTFDHRFYDQLGEAYRFQRFAYAINDNTWHEGERLPGLNSVEGRAALHIRHRVICNLQGLQSNSRLFLEARVRVNHCFEDQKQMIFCPSTFLPWALMGATLWRKRAVLPAAPIQNAGYRPVILAPRLLERLLRQRLPLVCTHKHFEPEAQVGNPMLTFTHEPKIDGMIESSPFDDLGRPRNQTPMIFQGMLVSFFGIDPLCAEWSPQGLRAQLSNFFIRPGRIPYADLPQIKPHTLQIENAVIEQISNLGPNAFTLRLTEAMTTEGQLLPPHRYRLSGTIASTLEGAGLLESMEMSREVLDTGSAVLPYALCQLYLHPA